MCAGFYQVVFLHLVIQSFGFYLSFYLCGISHHFSDWSFLMVPMSFFMLLSILITITLNSISDKLHLSILFNFFFPGVSPVLSFGESFFSPHFGCLFMFVFIYCIDLLWLSVFMGCPYVVGVLWVQWCSPFDHLSWVLEECSMYVLHRPSYCNWVLIAFRPFVHETNLQAGYLWGSTSTTACKLLCRWSWHETEFTSAKFGTCQDCSLDMLLVKFLDPVLMLSEAGHWVC